MRCVKAIFFQRLIYINIYSLKYNFDIQKKKIFYNLLHKYQECTASLPSAGQQSSFEY